MDGDLLHELLGDFASSRIKRNLFPQRLSNNCEYVMLYFSAHWSPPCRKFDSVLAEFYEAHKERLDFEVVLVSADRNESEFEEHFASMPWPAVPFEKEKLRRTANCRFKVSNNPKLVILSMRNNEVITTDGVASLLDHQDGGLFPWMPRTLSEIISSCSLMTNVDCDPDQYLEGRKLLDGNTVIGIYFSAAWSDPCTRFTSVLKKFYNNVADKHCKQFEIIYVSSDKLSEDFASCYGDMPWLAIQYDSPISKELQRLFSPPGIPALVVFDENLSLVTSDGHRWVLSDPTGETFPRWHPRVVNYLDETTAMIVSTTTSVILIGQKEHESEMLESLNGCEVAPEDDVALFYAYKGDDVINSFCAFLKVEIPEIGLLLVVDIKKYCKREYEWDRTTGNRLKELVQMLKEGNLEMEVLRETI